MTDAIIKKEIEDFKTFKNTSKKCKHLKSIEQKSYIKVLTPEKAKLTLEIRLSILMPKKTTTENLKITSSGNAKKEIETAKYFLKCNLKKTL